MGVTRTGEKGWQPGGALRLRAVLSRAAGGQHSALSEAHGS